MAGLLERERQLEVLHECLADTRQGEGRLVFVGGEAGAGKTALLRAFADATRAELRILCGRCDSLVTPRPLGPFVDVAADTGGALEELVGDHARPHEVLASVIEELQRRPTTLFLEDLHWADGATLDVVRLLGRRAEAVRALLVITYRNDEVVASHPLRIVLGELAAARGVRRLAVEPLSLDAVVELATPQGLDATELHRLTGGNPFFVTEAVAAGLDGVPETVRDAVLARAAHLAERPRRLLDVVAVITPRAEVSLLEAVAADELPALAECMAAGMLVEEYGGIGFRHELARAAVEEAIPADRRRTLHLTVLEALRRRPQPDLARLAHHAGAAQDREAVLELAPAAAKRAALAGAHREAAQHYGRALRFVRTLPPEQAAELYAARAAECHLVEWIEEALEAQTQALALYRSLGDALREGDMLRQVARSEWMLGRPDQALESSLAAVATLERLPQSRELAQAYAAMASHHQLEFELDEAAAWGRRALDLAERLGDERIVASTLLATGRESSLRGDNRGLERALKAALDLGLENLAGRAYGTLVFAATRAHDWKAADRWRAEGLRYCAEHDLEGARLYLVAWRAVAHLDHARWDAAAADAQEVLSRPSVPFNRLTPLIVLGLVRARRGDPDVWPPLDEASVIARGSLTSPRRLAPLEATRAEAAFLAGDTARALVEAGSYPARDLPDRWIAGRLAISRFRAGRREEPGDVPEPFAHELEGRHEAAASALDALECPYEAACALSFSDDLGLVRQAHERLLELGARPAAAIAARRLRERGARGLTRGPRRTTRDNPAGLTAREVDVLRLVAEGLRNAEIAERLFVSAKTVDHHVSAILRKLSARTRAEASAEAVRLGLVQQG